MLIQIESFTKLTHKLCRIGRGSFQTNLCLMLALVLVACLPKRSLFTDSSALPVTEGPGESARSSETSIGLMSIATVSQPLIDVPQPTQTITPTPHIQQTPISARQAAAAALTQVANRWATATTRIVEATAFAPTPDMVATEQELAAAVMSATIPEIIETYPSPDGQFRAEIIRYDCVPVGGVDENAYEQLKIVRVNDGTEMIIVDQLQYCGNLGAVGLGGLFWSPNGRYFYFTSARGGTPDGCCCDFWVRDMSRVDLTSGAVEMTPGMGELLADHKTIVIPGKNEFILWDLNKGEKGNISFLIPDALLITFKTAPEKKSMVYLQAVNCMGSPGKSYLIYWDFISNNHTLLFGG
jgi:hypothetical protein